MNAYFLLMSLGAHALGQTPMPPPTQFAAPQIASQAPPPIVYAQPTQTVSAPPTTQGPLPDPTNPSGPFKDLMKQKATGPMPSLRAPALALRGRVLVAGKEPSAMLDVDGKLALVSAGSVLAYGGSTLRVVEITSQEVRLEIGSSGEKLSLR
jgi:hypothetical protein